MAQFVDQDEEFRVKNREVDIYKFMKNIDLSFFHNCN